MTNHFSPRTGLDGPHYRWRSTNWLGLWAVGVVLVLSLGIGSFGLIEPDEGRNAEVAREMAETNNYVLPHLNGLPYLDKPVLFFAAAAVMIEILGPSELAVRLAPFLFALATALLVAWFADRLFGRQQAYVALVATATAPLVIALSRAVIMDTALSFFVVLALIAFHRAVEERRAARETVGRARSWIGWTVLAWAAMALGVLTKGPVALAVPMMVAVPYAVWRRASLAVWHPVGPVILAVVVTPWVWLVSREIPGFLHYVVVTETWARMTTDELRRTQPFWYFLPVLLAGAFPWSVVALSGLRSKAIDFDADQRADRIFLWLWLVLPLVFFSLSRGKQEQYMLPLVPAIALLVASRWSGRPPGIRIAAFVWGVVGAAMVAAARWYPSVLEGYRVPVEVAVRAVFGIGLVALVGAALAWWSAARRPLFVVIGLSLPLLAIPVLGAPAINAVAEGRSTRALASQLQPTVDSGTTFLWVESYAAGLSFYLETTIPVASSTGREFRSNYILRNDDLFRSDQGLLRPLEAAERALFDCRGPRVFLFDGRPHDLRAAVEDAGVPVLVRNRRWVAYGPDCIVETVEPSVDSELNGDGTND